jgi:hypothetical protein
MVIGSIFPSLKYNGKWKSVSACVCVKLQYKIWRKNKIGLRQNLVRPNFVEARKSGESFVAKDGERVVQHLQERETCCMP